MKNSFKFAYSILAIGLFSLMACSSAEQDFSSAMNDNNSASLSTRSSANQHSDVVLQWDQEEQTIDGFGVAQAGWADYLYAHRKREQVLDVLYSDKGLRLNILRGEVFPHYCKAEGEYDFGLTQDIDLSLDDPFFDVDYNNSDDNNIRERAARNGQLWITKHVKNNYPQVDKFIYSTWSAPAYMKSNGSASKGYLKKKYYQDFANYLSEFCSAYESVGLPVYAISPANEPEYAAPWNSSIWLPASTTLGKFIVNNLAPTFQSNNPNTKIIFGENAQWSGILGFVMGSKNYVNSIINLNRDIVNYPVIAAGHGYLDPVTKKYPSIEPFDKAESKNIPVWLTEISDPMTSYDPTMVDGLRWAKIFHQFLCEANVGAIIWWAGALPDNWSTEGLIHIDKNRVDYEVTKRCEVLGNFSRYIPINSKRISVQYDYKKGYMISAYKKGNQLTIVAINPNSSDCNLTTSLSQVFFDGAFQGYLTNADSKWESIDDIIAMDNQLTLNLPAESVVTYTGFIKE